MPYLFTSESVSEGHPDKVADQISDALIDNFLAFDPQSKVACETLVTTGQVVLAGEVKSKAYLDVQEIARGVIRKIGYTKSEYMFEANSCGILSAIHEQSADINQGVDKQKKEEQGAGDQGMMFGYAPMKRMIICHWHLIWHTRYCLNWLHCAAKTKKSNTCARMRKARLRLNTMITINPYASTLSWFPPSMMILIRKPKC